MSIIQIDGFKAYQNLDGTRSIIINSNNIDECMDCYYKNNLEGVAITNYHGYNLKDVNFLSEYQNIKSLSISESVENIEAIHSLTGLEKLSISGKKQKIDFQYLPNLKKVTLDWSTGLINLDKCKLLESLAIYSSFNPKTKDLTAISDIHWLKKLEINSSSITSFDGSENFNQLEELEFNYCPKLENISGFEKSSESLKSLIFGNCKAIKNHNFVVIFSNLNILGFNDSGVIESLEFIKKMKSLNSFRFVGSDVVDGDITPCVGLKFVNFTNKKQFTHKMEQLKIH